MLGSSFQTAAWLYSDIVRWLPIRSLPETRRSTGYQKANSVRSFFIVPSATPTEPSYGLPNRM